MQQHTVRIIRRHAVVYVGLAVTGVVIGWNQSRGRQARDLFTLMS